MIGISIGMANLQGGAGRPAVLWDFTNPADPLPGFLLTRATTGTYVAQDGSIQTATINQARFDWTGGVRALLVEPSATNLVLNSGDASLWVDGSSSTTVTRPVETNPFGSTAISLITKTLATSSGASRIATGSVVSGATYKLSAIVKKGATDYAQVVGPAAAFGINVWATFDLNNGAIGSAGPGVIGAPIMEPLGDGWYRCEILGAATATFSGGCLAVGLASNINAGRIDSISGIYSIKLCHAQLEQSARTSTIVTAGAAVTRAADSLASLGMSAIWAAAGSVQGTIVVDVEAGAPNSTDRTYLWNISDAGTVRLNLRSNTGGTTAGTAVLAVGNGTTTSDILIDAALRGRQRIAVSYANGAQPMVSRNGGAPQTHPLVYAHNAANTALQSLFGGFNGRVRSLAVYRNAVNAAQLAAMSVAA